MKAVLYCQACGRVYSSDEQKVASASALLRSSPEEFFCPACGHQLKPLYAVFESHPNTGSLWIGRIGTEEEVLEYVKCLIKEGGEDYISFICELREGWDLENDATTEAIFQKLRK